MNPILRKSNADVVRSKCAGLLRGDNNPTCAESGTSRDDPILTSPIAKDFRSVCPKERKDKINSEWRRSSANVTEPERHMDLRKSVSSIPAKSKGKKGQVRFHHPGDKQDKV